MMSIPKTREDLEAFRQKFWEFRDDEEPWFRLERVVTACTMGLKPDYPFGDCESCPAKSSCKSITQGYLAAARYRVALKRILREEATAKNMLEQSPNKPGS